MFRFSPSRLALAYVALSALALALFAFPLWYAWTVNLSTFREYVRAPELREVEETFRKDGAAAAAAAIQSRLAGLAPDEVVILVDPSMSRVAGNLPAWPAEVPEAEGTYGLVIDRGDSRMRVVVSHTRLPGGYHLLMGRESARFQSLVDFFWYGIAGAVAIVVGVGVALGWVIRRVTRTFNAILERQKAHLDELFDLAPDAVVLTDLSRPRILRINKEFTRVFGYTAEEAVGRPLRQLVVPADGQPADLTQDPDLRAGRKVEMEVVRRRKDGTRFHALVTAKRISLAGDNDAMYVIYRDITQRKEAEERLRRSEAFLAEGQRISRTGSWGWNLATGNETWSEEERRMLGFDAGVQPTVQLFLSRVHPEDRGRVRRFITESALEKRDYVIDYRVLLPGGRVRHMHSVGHPVVGASGEVEEYIGVSTDVTERVQAEAALKLSEQRYALAMEVTGDGHWDWNIPEDVYYASPIYLEMLGLAPDLVVSGRAEWLRLFPAHEEDYPKYMRAVEEHFAGGSSRLDMDMRIVPRGEVRWIHITGRCSRDASGNPVRWAGSVTDITARKHVDQELRARQDMLDLAQKAAHATAFEWWIGAPGEGDNRWSPDLELMYGVEPGSYDGTFEAWKEMVHPEDWPGVLESIRVAKRTGEVAAEYRVVHRGGAIRWLQAKGRMFFDAEGRPARVVGFMLDVTERREAEDELRNMERQLRQVQRLEAMGTLAGGIAHDFNNLLGAILGYGEMALRDAPPGTRLKRDLDSIMIAGERGRALVDRVLAFSRSGVSERVPVHVEGVVVESLDLIRSHLPAGISLETRLAAGRAAILGDATQIHQVVTNLATNALQAMPAGGTLRVSVDAMYVPKAIAATSGIVSPRDYVVIEVLDTGTGIPPKILDRIFDPFFTTKEVGVGTGLGLSLVHGIVTGLGGVIDVSTEVGQGSAFTVYLPRGGNAIDADAAPRAEPAEGKRGSGQSVLVVDDEESLVTLVVETLSGLGYEPLGFTSGAAALEAFAADPKRFDAVVTDESMPGMSGSEMIREMRRLRPSIPTLVVSGYLSAAIVRRVRDAGADEVLKKPISAHGLAASLDRALHPKEKARRVSRSFEAPPRAR